MVLWNQKEAIQVSTPIVGLTLRDMILYQILYEDRGERRQAVERTIVCPGMMANIVMIVLLKIIDEWQEICLYLILALMIHELRSALEQIDRTMRLTMHRVIGLGKQ